MGWLNGRRLAIYPRIFAAVSLAVWGFWILAGTGLTDRTGKPIGSDFLVFYAASSLALRGDPAAAYDFRRIHEEERSIVQADYPNPWVYPPTFLLIVLPLGLLPYLASLMAWAASTLSMFLAAVRRIAPHPATAWLALGFPGTFQNLTHGHNGFLVASLLGGGLLALERFPVLSGILFGGLWIKPHMAAPVLIALAAGRYWKTLGATILAAGGMALASGWALGWGTWTAFFGNIGLPLTVLEHEASLWGKMISAYAGFRLLGLEFRTALLFQGAVSLAAAGTLWRIWSRRAPFPSKASGLCVSALLITPYGFSYDLVTLALPLAWLGWEAHRESWKDLDKVPLVLGWILPFLAPVLGTRTGIPVAPVVLLWLLHVAVRRSRITSPPSDGSPPRQGFR